jgi:hypothetical protein
VTGRWFSQGPQVSSTNRTDCQDITEILLKVALKPASKQTNKQYIHWKLCHCVLPKIVLLTAETDVKKKKVKKVPKGTSEYQASWIVDSEDDEVSYLVRCS